MYICVCVCGVMRVCGVNINVCVRMSVNLLMNARMCVRV